MIFICGSSFLIHVIYVRIDRWHAVVADGLSAMNANATNNEESLFRRYLRVNENDRWRF